MQRRSRGSATLPRHDSLQTSRRFEDENEMKSSPNCAMFQVSSAKITKGEIVSLIDLLALLLARKNHPKTEATSSLRARKLLNRRCASV